MMNLATGPPGSIFRSACIDFGVKVVLNETVRQSIVSMMSGPNVDTDFADKRDNVHQLQR